MNETAKGTTVDVSIVIPVHNEEENLEPLMAEIEQAMKPLGKSYEVLCVDDKSTDSSVEVMRRLQGKHPQLRIVRHTRNCGESAGQATGFRYARGAVVITMDGDGQNDPADIPRLLEALRDGVDCVCGIRRKREDDAVKRLSSKIGNGFRRMLTGDNITDAGCTYRAIRRDAVREMMVFNGMHRFLPTILRLQGRTAVELPINHRPRTRGVSKYGVGNRLWRGILDCLAIRWYRRRALPLERSAEPE